MQKAGLYFHFPFCIRKCGYCDFYSITRMEHQKQFVQALLCEMALLSPHYRDFIFDTIYFGGGTPSLLEISTLQSIHTSMNEFFTLSPEAEFTIEVNPGTINHEKLTCYRKLGCNRLSIGAQSFHQADLNFLGRIHTVSQIFDCVKDARQAGFDNINIDLMTAFPGLTRQHFQESLQQAVSLGCEHVSCYTLIFEPNTPFFNRLKKGTLSELSPDQEAEFYETANLLLADHGYTPYEISNFSHGESYYCRHNLKYWQHEPYLGLGPSAHSFINPYRWRNVRTLPAYLSRLEKPELPVMNKEMLTPQQMEFEYIFLNLRLKDGIDLNMYQSRFQDKFVDKYRQEIQRLHRTGMIDQQDNRIRLSSRGWLLADEVASLF